MTTQAQSGYELVVKRIFKNEYIEPTDRIVVKRVAFTLSLDGPASLVDVDTKIKAQMDAEADIVYLLGEYEDKLYRYDNALERMESVRRLALPDRDGSERKYNEADRAAMLTIDQDIQRLRAKAQGARSLYRDIDRLAKILFNRNKKLELLVPNYRREVAADSNQ